ncbi:MAG: nitrilase family protein [Bacteroidales bacterium]
MPHLKISLIQSELYWEAIEKNLEMFAAKIRDIDGQADLVVLPEMFTTGFTSEPRPVAEVMEGRTMKWMEEMSRETGSVVTGSMVVRENNKFYNRLIWMPPDGKYAFYDKNHLFTFAGEDKSFEPGGEPLIVELKGWKIMLSICYDLRFPVWCRNSYSVESGFKYDCLLNVANWPEARSHAWRILLMSRAIENQAYVVGVNRVGKDGNDILYSGDSAVISPQGDNLSNIMPFKETSETVVMTRCQLDDFRKTFKSWADWDNFSLES